MNGGRNVKIGDDKREIPIIPNSEVPLYDLFSGEVLTDEFGIPIVTEVDEYFTDAATIDNSTSVVFSTQKTTTNKEQEESIGIKTATYSLAKTNNIGINTENISVGDIIIGQSIPEGTIVSRIGIGSIFISNFTSNSGAPRTESVQIKRIETTQVTSNPVWKVAEQFPELSEVSTTLLGINREEKQLSLFANVSSYGLDPDDFEYFSFSSGIRSFGTWDNRKNKTYGNRYYLKVTEETQESSIKISIFPVPYTFPFGPKFDKYGEYNSAIFPEYLRFIKTGNDLYNYYKVGIGSTLGYPTGWEDNFLSPSVATTFGSNETEDVNYVAGFSTAFAQIDTWTEVWKRIRVPTPVNALIDPVTGEIIGESYVQKISPNYSNSGTRGGYSSAPSIFLQLQSRRVFRYQPGRISGYTFGLRSSKENVNGVELEWGIENPTDQYVFKIFQGNLYIIRRSTVPLENSVLVRNGLTSADQVFKKGPNPYDSRSYYTIELIQDKFNGDTLRGIGDSVHLLDPEKVTMYKIEFGWYGAIGARFYAYVPVNNDEARWVVIHTLVIEDQLGRPCLQDSYFRFKYSIKCFNTEDISTPHYVYKYGASYYIDGGDEGNFTQYSISSGEKTLFSKNSNRSTSLFGILPKDDILNSTGTKITNKKLIIPTELTLTSDSLSEIKIVKCIGCPGFGHVYTPGVATTESGRYVNIQFSDTDNNIIEATDDASNFTVNDIGAKLIAPSIYDAYISEVSDPVGTGESFAKARIKGVKGNDRNIPQSTVFDRVVGIATTIPVGSPYSHPVRLSNYNTGYVASDYKFTGSKIEIQFVNPTRSDDYAHYADFIVGITDVEPVVTKSPNSLLGFNVGGATTTILPNSSILYGEYKHEVLSLSEDGVETGESIVSGLIPMAIDYNSRLPRLSGTAGGICSKTTITVLNPQEISGVTELNVNPQTGAPGIGSFWIEKQGGSGTFPDFNYDGGQIALKSGNTVTVTNSRFVGIVSTYSKIVNGQPVPYSYIRISNTLNKVGAGQFSIVTRPLQITGGKINSSKIFNYNPYPLYLVLKLKDNAQINNISIKETSADEVRTLTPILYTYDAVGVTTDGNADPTGRPATNFQEINRLSGATIDTQNQQQVRPYTEKDTIYVSPDQVNRIDLTKTFGIDRNVITSNVYNTEATFIIARKLDGGDSGTIESTMNFKEQ